MRDEPSASPIIRVSNTEVQVLMVRASARRGTVLAVFLDDKPFGNTQVDEGRPATEPIEYAGGGPVQPGDHVVMVMGAYEGDVELTAEWKPPGWSPLSGA